MTTAYGKRYNCIHVYVDGGVEQQVCGGFQNQWTTSTTNTTDNLVKLAPLTTDSSLPVSQNEVFEVLRSLMFVKQSKRGGGGGGGDWQLFPPPKYCHTKAKQDPTTVMVHTVSENT